MLSAHAIPCDRDWLRELIRPMEENSGVAGVYGKQIPLPEHSSNPIVRALSVEAYPTSYGSKPFITNRSSFFSNANSAIRVEHWRVNHFDEDVDYCEDRLWARSTIAEGGLIAYQPAAAVYHSHPDNFSLFFNRMYREIKTMRTHDPVQYPLLTKRELIKNLKFLLISYIRESLKNRSPRGLQWDLFRYKSIIELSSYIARKDAEIG
jgi:cellulose synthase/poly-beta-1,6-N-acetylglucosamine synthase-like glycosyltransferase